ncbi:unnamed protein product [Rhizophagus irregularis]|nr:unnamed protein product [Rhizophagus irregularis]
MEKPSFVRVGFRVPKNGKIPRFDLVGFQRTKTQRFDRIPKNENLKIKIHKTGWASEERKPKDSIGWASEKRKPKDKDSCGGLLTNENPKIKICSGRCLPISEEWKKPRFWASEEQRKTKIRLVSRVGSDKQKKTKDSFGGFPKDQDS